MWLDDPCLRRHGEPLRANESNRCVNGDDRNLYNDGNSAMFSLLSFLLLMDDDCLTFLTFNKLSLTPLTFFQKHF